MKKIQVSRELPHVTELGTNHRFISIVVISNNHIPFLFLKLEFSLDIMEKILEK